MGFGLGVGLQSKPPLYENIYLQRQKMGMDKTAAADEKKRQRDEENLGKYGKSLFVDPSKYHRTLIGEAEKVGSNALAELQKLRNGSPNEWMGQANVLANKTLAELGALQQESKQYWTEEALTPKTPAQQRYIAALKTGRSRDDLKSAAAGDPFGSVSINPTSGQTYIAHVEPGKDLPGDMRKAILDQKNFIEQQVISKNISPEFAKVYSVSSIPKNQQEAMLIEEEIFKNTGVRTHVASVDEIAKQFAENPDYQLQYKYDNQNSLYDFETGQKKGADDNATIAKSIYDLAYSMATPKVDVSIRNRPKDANAPKVTSGNSVQYGKVTASYSQDDNGTEYVDFQWIPTEAQNAKRIFSIGGKNVEGIPKRIIRDAGKAPELEIYIDEVGRNGKTGNIITERVAYDKFSNEIKNQYGFNFATVLSDLDLLDKKPEERKGVIGTTTANPVNPTQGTTKTTVEAQKAGGKKYTSAGIKAQAQKLGISEKQLKDKILLQFPDATFE